MLEVEVVLTNSPPQRQPSRVRSRFRNGVIFVIVDLSVALVSAFLKKTLVFCKLAPVFVHYRHHRPVHVLHFVNCTFESVEVFVMYLFAFHLVEQHLTFNYYILGDPRRLLSAYVVNCLCFCHEPRQVACLLWRLFRQLRRVGISKNQLVGRDPSRRVWCAAVAS